MNSSLQWIFIRKNLRKLHEYRHTDRYSDVSIVIEDLKSRKAEYYHNKKKENLHRTTKIAGFIFFLQENATLSTSSLALKITLKVFHKPKILWFWSLVFTDKVIAIIHQSKNTTVFTSDKNTYGAT